MFLVGSVKSCVCVYVCVCVHGGGGCIHHAGMRVSIRRWVCGVCGRGGMGEGALDARG